MACWPRFRALLTSGQEAAEGLCQEAISMIGSSQMSVQLARSQLLYGEWLRREHRRTDAREQLRAAHQPLAAMGGDGFAERAVGELQATGERARKRTTYTPCQLTARQTQAAWLAGAGLSNPEVAARLFMSPRTVEYYLHKIFTKLAISSLKRLRDVLASHGSE